MSSTLNIIITDAGIAEVVNAQHTGTAPVVLAQVGFGRGVYTPSASQTALHDEIKRVSTIAGGVVGDNIMHIQALDDGESAYAVYEVGVYTASGTLFAVYSQPLPILHKVANSAIMCVIDFVLSGVEPTAVTVGDTDYTLAPATTTNQGVVELATQAEVDAGTDTERAITPAGAAASYVSLSKDQSVTGKKSFEDVSVGRMNLVRNLVTNPDDTVYDLGVLETYKNDDDDEIIHNEYFVYRTAGSYNICIRNASGDPDLVGAEMFISHTDSYASTYNGARLCIQGPTVGTYHGFSVAYNVTASANVATISAEHIDMKGDVQFNDGFTGVSPSYTRGDTEVTVPLGGIVAVWLNYPGYVLVGEPIDIRANSRRVAYNYGGTMQESSKFIPAGTYVPLMDTVTQNTGGTWALLQRTA